LVQIVTERFDKKSGFQRRGPGGRNRLMSFPSVGQRRRCREWGHQPCLSPTSPWRRRGITGCASSWASLQWDSARSASRPNASGLTN